MESSVLLRGVFLGQFFWGDASDSVFLGVSESQRRFSAVLESGRLSEDHFLMCGFFRVAQDYDA